MATEATTVSAVREALIAETQKKADAINAERKGKGTRVRVGQTRGKNPKVITWEAFDTEQPETLPVSVVEFAELTKTETEKQLVSFTVDGYNAYQYGAASDLLAEFVEPDWSDSRARQFKLAVTNYANATGTSLEDAVALIKPGVVKAFAAQMAAATEATK